MSEFDETKLDRLIFLHSKFMFFYTWLQPGSNVKRKRQTQMLLFMLDFILVVGE